MKVTLPIYNLLLEDCGCDCGLPTCDENTIKCESASVDGCGFFYMPSLTAIPPEESCIIYKKVTRNYAQDIIFPRYSVHNFQPTIITGSDHQERSCITEQFWETISGKRYCNTKETTSLSINSHTTEKYLSGSGATIAIESYVGSSSSSPDSECSGTLTVTSEYPPDPEETDTGDFPTCVCDTFKPTNDWTYAGGGSFNTSISSTDANYTLSIEYSDPLTVADLKAELETRVAALTGSWGGDYCTSSVRCSYTYAGSAMDVKVCSQPVSVTTARYKMGVPYEYKAYRIAKDEWDECKELADTPEEEELCGTEPALSAYPSYKYYAIQWDTVFFPLVWDDWKDAYDLYTGQVEAHEQWVIDHAEWEILHAEWEIEHDAWQEIQDDFYEAFDLYSEWWLCNDDTPGECGEQPPLPPYPEGPEPIEPSEPTEPVIWAPNPGAEPESPYFVDENKFWEWTGTKEDSLDSMYSSWYVLNVPDDATGGEVRIVNKQVKCFRSARMGSPPTYYGETWNPSEE